MNSHSHQLIRMGVRGHFVVSIEREVPPQGDLFPLYDDMAEFTVVSLSECHTVKVSIQV